MFSTSARNGLFAVMALAGLGIAGPAAAAPFAPDPGVAGGETGIVAVHGWGHHRRWGHHHGHWGHHHGHWHRRHRHWGHHHHGHWGHGHHGHWGHHRGRW